MKRLVLLLLLYFTTSVSAADCDCSNYPFKPNPPCYSMCVAKLSSGKDVDLSSIKNINHDVSAAIAVLSKRKDQNSIKFESINGEADLKRVAASDGRIDYAPSYEIDLILKRIKIALDVIEKGDEGEETSKLIKATLDSVKTLNTNDKSNTSVQRAKGHLKKARANAKAKDIQEAEQQLIKAHKKFQDIKGLM